VGHVEGDYFFH